MKETIARNIKPNYKKTPVGIIPEDWEVKEMGDLSKVNQGLQIPIAERFLEKVEDSYFYITNEFLKKNSKKNYYIKNPPKSVICDADDILMTRTGNTGTVVTGVTGAFHNNFFKIDFDKKLLLKDYLYDFLISPRTQFNLLVLAGNSTIPDLNHSEFYKLKLPIPPIPEQKAIAACLSIWDRAIEKQTQLIQAKKEFKKGLMQGFFNGQLSIINDQLVKAKEGQDFTEDWEEVRLGKCLDYEQPTKYLENDFNDKKEENNIPVLTANQSFILGYTQNTDGIYNDYPVIIFDDFTTASRFIDFPFKVKSSAIKFLKAKAGFNLKFMFELLQGLKIEVSSHKRRWISEFSVKKVKTPTLELQSAIAQVLQSGDQEIELLEKKLEQLHLQKKGLMQVLLTGEKRLV